VNFNEKIGWIGLGKMGNPMAQRLINEGLDVVVYDIDETKNKKLINAGAKVANSISELEKNTDILISMVTDDKAIEKITIEGNGIFCKSRKQITFIDMSTISPDCSLRIAEKAKDCGIKYLNAPVSGSTALAEQGSLTFICSGSKEAYENCSIILDILGKKFYFVGYGEESRFIKLILEIMVGISAVMVGEALTFGRKVGIDWDIMIDIVGNSAVASPLIGYKSRSLKNREYDAAFTGSELARVLDIALDNSNKYNVMMPLTALTRQILTVMIAEGRGEMDFFAIHTLIEKLSGVNS
jgi:3-hydroxyisobutyrate dehydrogenase-like beta-hydroxyacid dehydrogenase